MRKYASSRVKRRSFYRKSDLQMFQLISGGHIGGQFLSTSMASPYKALQRCVKCFGTNSETVGHKDLRFGQIVYILVFYNVSFSWLLPLDGFQFIFFCSVYCVTVKTKKLRSYSWIVNLLAQDQAPQQGKKTEHEQEKYRRAKQNQCFDVLLYIISLLGISISYASLHTIFRTHVILSIEQGRDS